MKNLLNLFKVIKQEFGSLWTFKERGTTLEIVTPYATTTNKFISVFLTKKNEEFIVSDGGWLYNENYETAIDFDDNTFIKIFQYYQDFYDIKRTTANEIDFYFKKTGKEELVPNLVFDIANFVSAISSNSQIQFVDKAETEERERFNKQATTYLKDVVLRNGDKEKPSIAFRKSIDDKLKSIKFSAVVTNNNKLTLINYVTGSTPEYFINSIGKANITFEVINKSAYKSHINRKVALINDTATGFERNKLTDFLEQLENTTKHQNIFWNEKDRLRTII